MFLKQVPKTINIHTFNVKNQNVMVLITQTLNDDITVKYCLVGRIKRFISIVIGSWRLIFIYCLQRIATTDG